MYDPTSTWHKTWFTLASVKIWRLNRCIFFYDRPYSQNPMNLRDWPRLQSILSSEASWHCLLSSWFFIVIGINEGKMSYRDFSPDSMISNFSFSWFQKPDLEIWSTTVQTKTSSKNLIWRLRATWIWFRQIFEETLAKKGLIASWKSPENGTILVFQPL